ncbi:MAG: restriction endonuclease subunit S, partial [Eggerthellaceae bacterium]|nr:restriction endonuclease subunit S [Eggerthellaceae bacterium]
MRLLFEDFCEVTSSKRCHLSERSNKGVPFYRSKEIIQAFNGEKITDCDYIDEDLYASIRNKFGVPQPGDLLVTSRGSIGVPYLYTDADRFYFADGNLTWLRNFDSQADSRFLYYWFLSPVGKHTVDSCAKGTAQKAVAIEALKRSSIDLPVVGAQRRIASILMAYDNIIENNRRQITLLEEAADLTFANWRDACDRASFETGVMTDFFDITIGKTPPRAQAECFVAEGVPWASVKDLGNTPGPYISSTNECLTDEAIENYKVKVKPAGTILLSFKLTIGRIAIAEQPTATNEAIAHFETDTDAIRLYTYEYLRSFDYDTLGSTSSIGKA